MRALLALHLLIFPDCMVIFNEKFSFWSGLIPAGSAPLINRRLVFYPVRVSGQG